MNKVVIAKNTDREEEIAIKPHLGPKGWEKDSKLFSFTIWIQDMENVPQAEIMKRVADNEEFPEMLNLAFGEDFDMEKFTLMEIFSSFIDAVAIRMGRTEEEKEEIEEAEKK